MMKIENLWDLIHSLSNSWLFLAITTVVAISIIVIAKISNKRSRTSWHGEEIMFPVFLLIYRKIALYIPISGTISTADRVIFWSGQAYIFFIYLIFLVCAVVLAIHFREKIREKFFRFTTDWEYALAWFWDIVVVTPFIMSAIFLPVDGASHLYMPIISLIGIIKIFTVSPILLPIIWIGLLAHLWLIVFAGGHSGRQLNKVFFSVLLLGGCLQLGFQIYNFKHTPVISEIRDRWRTANRDDKETGDFLGVWADDLPAITKWGVHAIEKKPYYGREGEINKIFDEMPSAWTYLVSKGALLRIFSVGLGFVFMLVFIERILRRGA